MISIKELVRIFYTNYGTVPAGSITIHAILTGDPYVYLEASSIRNKSILHKVFADYSAFHQEDIQDVRKLPCPIQPKHNAHLESQAARDRKQVVSGELSDEDLNKLDANAKPEILNY